MCSKHQCTCTNISIISNIVGLLLALKINRSHPKKKQNQPESSDHTSDLYSFSAVPQLCLNSPWGTSCCAWEIFTLEPNGYHGHRLEQSDSPFTKSPSCFGSMFNFMGTTSNGFYTGFPTPLPFLEGCVYFCCDLRFANGELCW